MDRVLETRTFVGCSCTGGAVAASSSSLRPEGLMSRAATEGGGTATPSSESGTAHSSSSGPAPRGGSGGPSGERLPARIFQNSRSHSTSSWMLSWSCNMVKAPPLMREALTRPRGLPGPGATWLRLVMSCQGTKPVSTTAPPPRCPLSKAIPKSLMKRQPMTHSSSPKVAILICLRRRKPPCGYTASQSACSCGSGRSHCLGFGIFTARNTFSSSTMFLRTSATTDTAPAGRSSLAIWR
mmetsp:Transcript_124499/g.387655  ORF Transcript_124499/g.387655 Transcript_124499/m.387655 type:complete len:239 (+) Transcript_124499:782-1498(+)